MHLVFYARGIIHSLNLFETLAQSQFFKWRRINLKDNKEEVIMVQGALRKSILGAYEYVFPREALPDVLAMFSEVLSNPIGNHNTFLNKAKLKAMQKVFGCKDIPKDVIEKAKKISPFILLGNSERALSNIVIPGVAIHVIGIKEDIYDKFPLPNPEVIQEYL